MISLDFVPTVLKKFDHWVYWVDSKKIPMNPNARGIVPARPNDPKTWGSFDQVKKVLQSGRGAGIGFMFSDEDPFVGIDLDHVYDPVTGIESPIVSEFEDFLYTTYAELSMSRTGIHMIIQSELPKWFLGDNVGGRKIGNMEFYQASHYLALTGFEYDPTDSKYEEKDPADQIFFNPVKYPEHDLDLLLRKLFPDEYSKSQPQRIISAQNGKSIFENPEYDADLYDDDLIRWLCVKVPKFSRAFEYGDSAPFNGDESKRDFFVCTQLLSLFQGDSDRMKYHFERSACMHDIDRKKSHQTDYLNRTFSKAVESWNGFTYNVQINVKRSGTIENPNIKKKSATQNLDSTTQKNTKSDLNPTVENQNPTSERVSVSEKIPTVYNNPEVENDYLDFENIDDETYFRNTDRNNSKIFVSANKPLLRFCLDMLQKGCFLVWYGARWFVQQNPVQCWNMIDNMIPIYKDLWLESKSQSERKNIAQAQHRIEMSSGIESCLAWVRADQRIQVMRNELNQQRFKLCFENGVLDLESETFDQADPADLFTLSTKYDFDHRARSDLWINTIEEIVPDKETRSSLQTFLGYCLSGDTSAEKFAYFFGTGGNGKGTLLRVIIEALGQFATVIPIDLFIQTKFGFSGESATPQLAKLEYARFAVADEIPDDCLLMNSKLKSVTGGDLITVRPMYSDPITFDPQFKLVLSGNIKADFATRQDVGIQRRLLFYHFEQTFDDTTSNRNLKRSLLSVKNLQGVMNWLIEGYRRYKQFGIFESKKMKSERDDYLKSAMPKIDSDLQKFVDENIILDPNGRIPRMLFLETFRKAFPRCEIIDKILISQLFKYFPSINYVNYGGTKVISGIRFKS